MTSRVAGDVYVLNSANAAVVVYGSVEAKNPNPTIVSVDTTTSATVVIISVNTTGCNSFAITNFGSLNVYIEGSYNGTFFQPSVAVTKMVDNVSINTVSASTAAQFSGPFLAMRVIAASASGIWRAALTYR